MRISQSSGSDSAEKPVKPKRAGKKPADPAEETKAGAPDKASDVKLSPKAKAAEAAAKEPEPVSSDKEIKQAETLMDHVNTGKLSPEEHELAMKRISEIVKKYGNA